MPIEDVEYLLQNSTTDSFFFFVDSSKRDKSVFPTPSSYVVTFVEPYTNVYGVEIMTSTMPSTMYNIDYINNSLKYFLFWTNTNASIPTSLGNSALCNTEISNNLKYQEWLTSKTNNVYIIIGDQATSPSNLNVTLYDSAHYTTYKSDQFKLYGSTSVRFDFVMFLRVITTVQSLIINNNTNDNTTNNYYFRFNSIQYSISKTDVNYDTVIAFISQKMICNIIGNTIITYDMSFVMNDWYSNNLSPINNWNYFIIFCGYISVEQGNYDITTLMQYMNAIFPTNYQFPMTTTNVSISTMSSSYPFNGLGIQIVQRNSQGDIKKQVRYAFNSTDATNNILFAIDLTMSTITNNMGFAVNSNFSNETQYFSIWNLSFTSNNIIHSVYNANAIQTIIPMGIVNLQGVRYIIMRCPEIEGHIYSSFTQSEFCPGIGMFKLGANNEIVDLRFDFVSYVKKPFHPIGRLIKLTFSFEIAQNELYDFKGVDHNILLLIKCYAPTKKIPDKKHIYQLNPNYNPDFSEYMLNAMQKRFEEDEVDDDDDDADETPSAIVQKMITEQNKYDDDDEDDDNIVLVNPRDKHFALFRS